MQITGLITAALLLLTEAETVLATSIVHFPDSAITRDMEQHIKRSFDRIMRREPQAGDATIQNPATDPALNQSIAIACIDALQPLTGVDNEAGFTSCFNILSYDAVAHRFEADLRLYQTFAPRGAFSNISINDVMISLTFPLSTTFQSLTKRKREIVERQSNTADMLEIQQYTLFGQIQSDLDLNKLNNTQIMALMLPEIKLNTAESQRPLSSTITPNDGAWFVFGEFKDAFDQTRVTPAAATDAISIAVPYVLPGVSLGIFPTGLIITAAWTFIFLLAYGFGTIGRIQYRTAYRKRMAIQMGRTGKKI